MATLLLQVAGSVVGTMLGGPIGAVIGQALGGIAGSQVDQAVLGGGGGNKVVEGPRLSEMAGLSSSEGQAIPRAYGRVRLGGQLIWATRFEEVVTTTVTRSRSQGGKGGRASQNTYETSYSYHANLAVGLCEGPIAFVRRIWADGRELDFAGLNLRVHRGHEDQAPDPLIVAKEAGETPAYRGLAYVVFERFPLAEYGNRVPQFSFEVVRAVPGVAQMLRAVTLIPGASEFIYHPQSVSQEPEPGISLSENRHQLQTASDVDSAIAQLLSLCPNLRRISLVVSWFGDDLRAGDCTVAPRVEAADKVTFGALWSVAGLDRASAALVSRHAGHAAYGGTPSDGSVIALIRRLREVYGVEVMLYPFVMMDIPGDNALPDPHSGGGGQPAYPWRGRITCAPAPDRPGTPDGSAAAAEQIAAFLGTATAADFSLDGDAVLCGKPDEWSFRRHILHCAVLAKAAGGVEGFIIGSELVGLTRVRSAGGAYPMVDGLVSLAGEVRAILGPATKLTYAADWTEYGAHVRDGGAELRFPLDPLWAAPQIDAVGIDYYAPLSDWRDGPDHADQAIARGPSDLDYLRTRLTAGEGYDWYYADQSARLAQNRTPITDGAYGKPWVFRVKDLPGWWTQPHVERAGGVEIGAPTAWVPGSKPIWLTEIGLPAVDKGGNAPNLFPDAKSAESGYPPFSSRGRDDLVQARGLEAILSGFDPAQPGFDPARNPVDPVSGLRMVDPSAIFAWTWDARPFPAFPDLAGTWADAANWETGHWLNGRLEGLALDRLVKAILGDYGLPVPDEITLDGFLDGYAIERPMAARAALEPLAQAFGFDATMSSGRLAFRDRAPGAVLALGEDDLVPDRGGRSHELRRGQETELPRELRLGFFDGDDGYRQAAARSRRLAGAARREIGVETPIVTRRAEGQRLAELRLQEAWAGRETLDLELSPRCLALEPGDLVSLPAAGAGRLFRVTRIGDAATRRVSARGAEPGLYRAAAAVATPRRRREPPPVPGRPAVAIFSLPVARSARPPLLWLAAFAQPWPGALSIWREELGGGFSLLDRARVPAVMGETLTPLSPGPLWRSDASGSVDIRLRAGALASLTPEQALAGQNALALVAPDGEIEIVVAASAELIGDRSFRLSGLLRGLAGSEDAAARLLAPGAGVVLLDPAVLPLSDDVSAIGHPVRYRVGAARYDVGDPMVVEVAAEATAAALRPLAPVHVRARRGGEGVALSWVRRSRLDADSWDVYEVPLGEESESYRVIVHKDGLPIRSFVATAPFLLYPVSEELADFAALQPELDVSVAQISAVAGDGTARRGRIAVS